MSDLKSSSDFPRSCFFCSSVKFEERMNLRNLSIFYLFSSSIFLISSIRSFILSFNLMLSSMYFLIFYFSCCERDISFLHLFCSSSLFLSKKTYSSILAFNYFTFASKTSTSRLLSLNFFSTSP